MLIGTAGGGRKNFNPSLKVEADAAFAADYRSGIATPLVDQGSGYTYDRDTASEYITDFEGIVKQTLADEIGYDGLRRVENLIPEGIGDVVLIGGGGTTFTYGIADPDGGNNAVRVTVSSTAARLDLATWTPATGNEYVYSVWIKIISAGGTDTFKFPGGATYVPTISETNITITSTEWNRYTSGIVNTCATPIAEPRVIGETPTNVVFDIYLPQWEDVTGQDIQNPSEYVSVGVGTESDAVINGDFSTNDLTGWTDSSIGDGVVDASSGAAVMSASSGENAAGIAQNCLPDPGKMVSITFTATRTSGNLRLYLGTSSAAHTYTASGTYNLTARVDGTDNKFLASVGLFEDGNWTIDNIVAKEIDHGTNVDGVKYFNYANPNEVSSNVVTDSGLRKYFQPSINKGVNVWEGRTNLHPESHDFDTGWLFVSQTAATDTQLGIDGRLAFLHTNTADSGSIFYSRVYDDDNDAWIDGAVVAFTNTPTTSWQRESRQFTTPVGCTVIRVYVPMKSNNGTNARYVISGLTASTEYTFSFYHYVGSADNNVYIDGVQVEEGAFVTPVIQTDGGTASRNADDIQYDAANYSDEMTVLCEFDVFTSIQDSNQFIFTFDGAGANDVYAYISPDGYLVCYRNADADYSASSNPKIGDIGSGNHKLAMVSSLTGSLCRAYLDGISIDNNPTEGDAGYALTIDTLQIGNRAALDRAFNGNIKNFQVIHRRLSDAELAAWSTL